MGKSQPGWRLILYALCHLLAVEGRGNGFMTSLSTPINPEEREVWQTISLLTLLPRYTQSRQHKNLWELPLGSDSHGSPGQLRKANLQNCTTRQRQRGCATRLSRAVRLSRKATRWKGSPPG